MRRRTVLTALMVSPLTGCTSIVANGDSNSTNDEGDTIKFEELSPESQKEVRKAVNQGEYTTCQPPKLLKEVETGSDIIVKYNGSKYNISIGHGDKPSGSKCDSTYTVRAQKIDD